MEPTNINQRRQIVCRVCKEKRTHHAKGMCYPCYKQSWRPKLITCKHCGQERPHKAFGLCGICHFKLHHYEKQKRRAYAFSHNIDQETYKKLTGKCAICEFTDIVELHHLDGDHENNQLSNLVGLCPNHYRMVHDGRFTEQIKEKIKECRKT